MYACGGCKRVAYDSKEEALEHWEDGHWNTCGSRDPRLKFPGLICEDIESFSSSSSFEEDEICETTQDCVESLKRRIAYLEEIAVYEPEIGFMDLNYVDLIVARRELARLVS